jgi:hypothetical protein
MLMKQSHFKRSAVAMKFQLYAADVVNGNIVQMYALCCGFNIWLTDADSLSSVRLP